MSGPSLWHHHSRATCGCVKCSPCAVQMQQWNILRSFVILLKDLRHRCPLHATCLHARPPSHQRQRLQAAAHTRSADTSSVISQLHARLNQHNKTHISSCATAAWLHPNSCRSSYTLLAPPPPHHPTSCLAVLSDNLQSTGATAAA